MRLFLFFTLWVFSHVVSAQSYNNALGMRLGDDYGYSFTQRLLNHTTLELTHQDGLFSGKKRSTAILKQHTPLLTRRFNFFVGAGIHRTTYNTASDAIPIISTGAAFTLGTEITIGRLSVSLDMSPTYHLSKTSPARFESSSGVSIRYVIWKRKSGFSKFIQKLKFW